MILKLGMKHQGMELYKVCINHDPDLFYGKVNLGCPCILMGENCVKIHLKGKTCSTLVNVLKFYDLKKKMIHFFIQFSIIVKSSFVMLNRITHSWLGPELLDCCLANWGSTDAFRLLQIFSDVVMRPVLYRAGQLILSVCPRF